MAAIMTDAELIDHYGGPTKLAALLGYGARGVQRVWNWRERGIPAAVKVARPELFLTGFALAVPRKKRAKARAAEAQAA